MNLILIHPDEIVNRQVRVSDRRAEHLKKILKVTPGVTVRIGIVGGKIGAGTVEELSSGSILLAIEADTPPPAKLGLDLILAVPRPIMLKRVLAQAAALGVNHLYLVNAKRVEKSFFEASPIKDRDFSPYLINGLEQAVDTIVPTVSIHPRFRPFIEDTVPTLPANCRILAHPETDPSLANDLLTRPGRDRTLLAIGPEGGWIDYELQRFREAGFKPFSLGPRILRVDTAVPAIIAQIALLQGGRIASSPGKRD